MFLGQLLQDFFHLEYHKKNIPQKTTNAWTSFKTPPQNKVKQLITSENHSAPKNGWLEDDMPFGKAYFSGAKWLLVSGRDQLFSCFFLGGQLSEAKCFSWTHTYSNLPRWISSLATKRWRQLRPSRFLHGLFYILYKLLWSGGYRKKPATKTLGSIMKQLNGKKPVMWSDRWAPGRCDSSTSPCVSKESSVHTVATVHPAFDWKKRLMTQLYIILHIYIRYKCFKGEYVYDMYNKCVSS